MGDNRPPVYYDDIDGSRVLVIRASAIGTSCLWELVAAGQGVEPGPLPAVLVRAFAEGTELEPKIVRMLEDMGVVFLSHQEEGHLWLSPDVVVRYHPDGIGELGSKFWLKYNNLWQDSDAQSVFRDLGSRPYGRVVVEIKALSNDLWQQAVRNGVGSVIDEYEWQLSVMMHQEQLPGLWVAYNKGIAPDGNGVKPPCADEGKLHFQYVPKAPVSLEELALKASLIKVGVDGEDILTSDKECGDTSHWPCRYLHVRPEPENPPPQSFTVPEDRQDEINSLVRDFLHNKGIVDEAEAARDRAKNRLLAYGDGYKKILTSKFIVPIIPGSNSYTAVNEMTEDERATWEALKAKYKRKTEYRFIRGIKRLE